jgi:hypothetical protein
LTVDARGHMGRQKLGIVQIEGARLLLSRPKPFPIRHVLMLQHLIARGHDLTAGVGKTNPGVFGDFRLNQGEPYRQFRRLLV